MNQRSPLRPRPSRRPPGDDEGNINRIMRSVLVWLMVFLGAFIVFMIARGGNAPAVPVSYNEYRRLLNEQAIERAVVTKSGLNNYEFRGDLRGNKPHPVRTEDGRTQDALAISTRLLSVDAPVQAEWIERGIDVRIEQEGGEWWGALLTYLPLLIIFIILSTVFLRRVQGGNGARGIFSFGKSRARMLSENSPRVTFADVAGADEAKAELSEVVEFLREPGKFQRLGAKIPRGVLLLGPPGTGKCVTGETLVVTGKGLMEIRDIPKYYWVDPETNEVAGARLASLDVDQVSNEVRAASHWYDLGVQPTLRITTKQGMAIEGTYEHPVVVLTGEGELEFRELARIREGDSVAVRFGTGMFGTLAEVDPEKAYFMGLMAGDGNMSIAGRVELTSTDDELVDFFHGHIRSRYGSDLNIDTGSRGITYGVSSWSVKKDLFNAGLSSLLSYDKEMPATILQAPRETVVAFLQGLFDADGSFTRYSFGYSTVSRRMADQVTASLLNLGVVPRLRVKNEVSESHPRRVYEVIVSGTSLPVFAREVGFRLTRKQAQLEEYLQRQNVGTNTNVDVIPGVAGFVLEAWNELRERGTSTSRIATLIDKVRTRGRISRASLRELVAVFTEAGCRGPAVERLRHLLDADLFFTPVETIEQGEARVYDFTVPGTHSFISNGLVSHNTLLSRAIAGEAGVQFLSISGADFVEMFVGVGASVTGDTPVLMRTENGTELVPIGEFVDRYYREGQEDYVVPVQGVQTLGFTEKRSKFLGSSKTFVDGSAWTRVRGVYRHRVNEIYEINYLGGMLRTTGDHSVFIRTRDGIKAVAARDLKPGDVLVNLPHKVRGVWSKSTGTTHAVRAHTFPNLDTPLMLDVEVRDQGTTAAHAYALAESGRQSQRAITERIGVSQATVGHWQSGKHEPRALLSRYTDVTLPAQVAVTPGLMRLMGYYTAEGRENGCLEFTFGTHETTLHDDCITLVRSIFGVEPKVRHTEDNSTKITFHNAPLGRFFARHCGTGSHNKRIPEFLWDMPRDLFLAYLRGYSLGDGYTTRDGNLSMTSVSQRLIRELTWLAAMHGIKGGVREMEMAAGRVIKAKPLPATRAWNLIIGRTSNPFEDDGGTRDQGKKAVVREIVVKPYDGFVYDLCGCDNEAFFGGEKPLLLHNSRVRDLFEQAKRVAPAIVFIDEIDAVGRQRGAGLGGGHDEREQTLNALLVEMDGFEQNSGVIVIAATNRPDVLDPALLRPGRFDRQVVVDLPDRRGREAILKVHTRSIPLAENVDMETLAKATPGFSGADIANLTNEAAISAARRNGDRVTMYDFEAARDKIMLGLERRSLVMSDEERRMTAYHEAGHVIVGRFVEHGDPVHKVTVIPRGRALGVTAFLPKDDSHSRSREWFEARIAMAMGGRAAELLIFGNYTSGAQGDIKAVTQMARQMVCELGMSESLGPVNYSSGDGEVFLGRDFTTHRDISEATAEQIDNEVRRIVEIGMEKAMAILREHMATLHRMSSLLVERETLDADEIETIVKGEELPPLEVKRMMQARMASGQSARSDAITVAPPGGSDTAPGDD